MRYRICVSYGLPGAPEAATARLVGAFPDAVASVLHDSELGPGVRVLFGAVACEGPLEAIAEVLLWLAQAGASPAGAVQISAGRSA